MGVKLFQVENYGAPKLMVEVDWCIIPKVLVDSGLAINLMLEDSAFGLE